MVVGTVDLMIPQRSPQGSPVGIWFLDGMPVRLVHEGRRFRVVDEQLHIDGDVDSWVFRARDEQGGIRRFEVRSAGLGWELVQAS